MRSMCTYNVVLLIFLISLNGLYCEYVNTSGNLSIRSVDVIKTRVWGSGIEPDKIILPVRYFYIQAIDAYGNA